MSKLTFDGVLDVSRSCVFCLAVLIVGAGPAIFAGCQDGSPVADQETTVDTSDGKLLLNAQHVKVAADNIAAQDAGEVRIFDVRSESDYMEGHVPGALFMNFSAIAAIAKQENGMHDTAAWSDALTPLGITQDTKVIIYGNSSVTTATRAWWLLKYVGVKNVAILNGGFDAWKSAGLEPSTSTFAYQSREFKPEFQTQRLVEITELKDRFNDPKVQLLDTRSDVEFTGERALGPRGGRIPGAAHLNWKELVDDTGRFKSKQELKKLFESRGALPNEECITYCQSGGRAAAEAFALEFLGYPNVRVYYASWQEWGGDESAEIEQGSSDAGN